MHPDHNDPPLIAGPVRKSDAVRRARRPRGLGHPRPCLRSGGKISVRAGPRLHAAAGTGRKVCRAAGSPRPGARRDRAGQCPRLRQRRRARRARPPRSARARRRHHRYARRAGDVAGLASARHARAALSRFLGRRAAGLRARGRPRRVRDLPAGDARARLGHAAVVRLARAARPRRQAARDRGRAAGRDRSHAEHPGGARHRRPGVPDAPASRRRRSRARQAVGAVSPIRAVSGLSRRAALSTTRWCAPIPNACSGAPTGRIRRSRPRSCRTTAISWIC